MHNLHFSIRISTITMITIRMTSVVIIIINMISCHFVVSLENQATIPLADEKLGTTSPWQCAPEPLSSH